MSVKDCNKKIIVKGNVSPSPKTIEFGDLDVNVTLSMEDLLLLSEVKKMLEQENGCEIWYSYMKN